MSRVSPNWYDFTSFPKKRLAAVYSGPECRNIIFIFLLISKNPFDFMGRVHSGSWYRENAEFDFPSKFGLGKWVVFFTVFIMKFWEV